MLYVKASQGFRAGGFSPTVNSSNAFNPETAKTYEAGARWELLDRRLRINPTVYYTLWDDIQFNAIALCPCYPSPLPFIKTRAMQKSGARSSSCRRRHQRFSADRFARLSGQPLLRHSAFLAQVNALQSDTPLAHAPKSSFTVGPMYSLPLPGDAKLIGTLTYTWQSKQRSATDDPDNVEIASYGLLNGA